MFIDLEKSEPTESASSFAILTQSVSLASTQEQSSALNASRLIQKFPNSCHPRGYTPLMTSLSGALCHRPGRLPHVSWVSVVQTPAQSGPEHGVLSRPIARSVSRTCPVWSVPLPPSRSVYLESNVIPNQSIHITGSPRRQDIPAGSTFYSFWDKMPRRVREHCSPGKTPPWSFIPPHLPSRYRRTAQLFGV